MTRDRGLFLACGALIMGLVAFAAGCAGTSAPPAATTEPAKPAATSAPAATMAPATVAPTKPAATAASTAAPAAAGTAPAKAASPGATTEAESAGQELCEANCAACHAANGAGGLKIGSATSADLRSPHLETLYNNDDALISRAILQGKDQKGEDLDAAMPRFQGKLTQQQVNQIIAYLKTLHQ